MLVVQDVMVEPCALLLEDSATLKVGTAAAPSPDCTTQQQELID